MQTGLGKFSQLHLYCGFYFLNFTFSSIIFYTYMESFLCRSCLLDHVMYLCLYVYVLVYFSREVQVLHAARHQRPRTGGTMCPPLAGLPAAPVRVLTTPVRTALTGLQIQAPLWRSLPLPVANQMLRCCSCWVM